MYLDNHSLIFSDFIMIIHFLHLISNNDRHKNKMIKHLERAIHYAKVLTKYFFFLLYNIYYNLHKIISYRMLKK